MTILIPVVGLLSTTLVLLLWYPKQIKTVDYPLYIQLIQLELYPALIKNRWSINF